MKHMDEGTCVKFGVVQTLKPYDKNSNIYS